MPDYHKDIFERSLARCRRDPRFLKRFYEKFLGHSREIREKFARTDFRMQRRRLDQALGLATKAVLGDPEALRRLEEQAVRHRAGELDIRPELYEVWLDKLLETVAEIDRGYDAEVDESWRAVLRHVIRHMQRHYQD